ncbi:hypothetical protein GOODEAATRI_023102 [Goodea atripinnis]|uniref:Uncharacterized protein n=1 Tax=Goodea atripinnis TaxID=208336 RepID=A0ABV0N3N2_9TELE
MVSFEGDATDPHLSIKLIEKYVNEAKANVDESYTYSRRVSIDRVKRNAAGPADVLRLLKQPSGASREAVRAADYMDNTLHLIKSSLSIHARHPLFVLPQVRNVSNHILKTVNSDVDSDPLYTHLITIFGQWTDHDLTFTPHSPSIRSFNGATDCDKSCANTEPSCGSGETGHIFGARTIRQQLNTLTSFIDAGQVYGSDDSKAHLLRIFSTDEGLLRVNKKHKDNSRDLLPFTTMGANMCATRRRMTNNDSAEEVLCFSAGVSD